MFVIGNSQYQVDGRSLETAVDDAREVHDTLRSIGFKDGASLSLNEELPSLKKHFNEFLASIEGVEDLVVLYYAGHAVSVPEADGPDYLILPTDFDFQNSSFDNTKAQPVSEFVQALGRKFRTVILIFDACRTPPPGRGFEKISRLEIGTPQKNGDNIVYFFATEQREKAGDKKPGTEHSPFSYALLRHLRSPGELISVFREVQKEVGSDPTAKHPQIPWLDFGLPRDIYLNPLPLRWHATVAPSLVLSPAVPSSSPDFMVSVEVGGEFVFGRKDESPTQPAFGMPIVLQASYWRRTDSRAGFSADPNALEKRDNVFIFPSVGLGAALRFPVDWDKAQLFRLALVGGLHWSKTAYFTPPFYFGGFGELQADIEFRGSWSLGLRIRGQSADVISEVFNQFGNAKQELVTVGSLIVSLALSYWFL